MTRLQRDLQKLGFYSGALNGNYDVRTKAAVKAFHRNVGIEVRARLSGRRAPSPAARLRAR